MIPYYNLKFEDLLEEFRVACGNERTALLQGGMKSAQYVVRHIKSALRAREDRATPPFESGDYVKMIQGREVPSLFDCRNTIMDSSNPIRIGQVFYENHWGSNEWLLEFGAYPPNKTGDSILFRASNFVISGATRAEIRACMSEGR